MDIKDFARLVKAKRGELDTLMRRNMPVIAGRMAKGRLCERRSASVEAGKKAVIRQSSGRIKLRNPAVRTQPPFQLHKIYAGGLPGARRQRCALCPAA